MGINFNWGTGYVIYYRRWDASCFKYISNMEFGFNLKDAKKRCDYIAKHYKIEFIELHYIVDGISERQYKI